MSLVLPTVEGLANQRCLVTGGAGFIGSTLVRILLASGAGVTVYDNLATGSLDNLAACQVETGGVPEWAYGDVRDAERLGRVLPGHDVVFHLACLGVRHSLHSPHENEAVNARGTLVTLSAARQAGIRRVVHVSSSEVYGTACAVPMNETHPTEPHTIYGAAKLAGESYARAFWRSYGMDVVVIRPFNAYGPRSHHEGDSGEVIPRFLLWSLLGQAPIIFGDGQQTRDLSHVYDTAATIARAAIAPGVAGKTLNVGAGEEIRIDALAKLALQCVGRDDVAPDHAPPRPGDVLRLYADCREAQQLLGHRTSIPLAAGLTDLAERLRALGPERLSAMAHSIVVRNWA